jgi:hypothetical protein
VIGVAIVGLGWRRETLPRILVEALQCDDEQLESFGIIPCEVIDGSKPDRAQTCGLGPVYIHDHARILKPVKF